MTCPAHLGAHAGKTHTDAGALSYMRRTFGCSSLLDVGCGIGGQVYLARAMGWAAWGVEGDPTVTHQIPYVFRRHDYTTGPYTEEFSKDLIWCCEFVEHVEPQYIPNFLATFRCAKYVLMTAAPPGKPGNYHVNCQSMEYWVDTLEASGWRYMAAEAARVRVASTMVREFMRETGMLFERRA